MISGLQKRIEDYKNQGFDKKIASSKTLVEWVGLQSVTGMKLVQNEVKDLINELHQDGVTFMGLTTRGPETYMISLHHLENLGVDFTHNPPYDQSFAFMNEEQGVIFKNGVLFTGASQKGKALFTLLDHAGYKPKHIVFINDKKKNLEEVQSVAKEFGVLFMGLRYGYLDDRVANYDHELAMEHFENYKQALINLGQQ